VGHSRERLALVVFESKVAAVVVHIDMAVAVRIRVDRWGMAVTGKVQRLLKVRPTTFHPLNCV
jgi:hypothetical protein